MGVGASLVNTLAFASEHRFAPGPLRVSASNNHWFVDPSGKAVYLAGSHIWQSLQDNGLLMRGAVSNPPPVFDFTAYLDFLRHHNHNFIRLWRWETPRWTDSFTDESKYCRPHPWPRSGTELGADGEPRFDLSRFDEIYFERLRQRVRHAGERGIYVAVMLFEGWQIQFSDAWQCHPFRGANNINGIEADLDGDGRGLEYNTLHDSEMGRRVLALQESYVRHVIDTVNEYDNVLYEIANEAHSASTEWQYHLIRFIKDYERGKPKQHPVGMTFQYKGGANKTLEDSPADWISPNPGEPGKDYRENPCADCSSKVVVSDTDHLWGHTGGNNVWVWKSFTRGLNVLFMEELLPSPTWQDSARQAMNQVREYAERMNLAAMKPESGVTQTGYCLAALGSEYLIFQHDKGEFTVNLKDAKGSVAVEWLDINANRQIDGQPVEGGKSHTFTTPFPGPAALYLRVSGSN
jgi:hypothetical protein